MVIVTGLSDPRSLVWKNSSTGRTYFISRVLGAEQRLFYLEELAPGATPTIANRFVGHLMRWSHLPEKDFSPIAENLAREYDVQVDVARSFVILGTSKPEGCP